MSAYMHYLEHVTIVALLFGVLSMALDLLSGRMGVFALCLASFYGIGAYSSALVSLNHQDSFLGVLIGAFLSVTVSIAISFPSFRMMRNDSFVIASFALQLVASNVMTSWIEVTRGPLGISGIAGPVILGWTVASSGEFLLLCAGFAIVSFLIVTGITSAPLGRILHAVREDEMLAQGLGYDLLRCKVAVFAVSAALASTAGSLFAHYSSYIEPSCFTINESLLVLCMAVIGGAGSKWGPILGALVLVALPEALRFVGLPPTVAANMRQFLYGLALVATMMWRPRGLIGVYRFGR